MATVRNLFVSLGVYLISLWIGLLVGHPLDKFGGGFTYGDNVFSAIGLGAVLSLRRIIGGLAAGVLIAIVIRGKSTSFWALVVAAVYALEAPNRFHPEMNTSWFVATKVATMLWPGVACVIAALVTAFILEKRWRALKAV